MIHIKDVEYFECVFFIIFILSTLWLQNLDGFVDNEKQSIRRPVGRAKLQFDPKTVIGLQDINFFHMTANHNLEFAEWKKSYKLKCV